MATASLPPVNLWVVLSESKRIINAHPRHFFILSVLFLLPLSFSAVVYQSIVRLIVDHKTAASIIDDDTATLVLILLVLPIAYVVVVTVFNLLAIGSISYSVFQGFYGRPLKLIFAVKSSFNSFFPLLATLISTNFIIFGILLILGFAVFLLTKLIKLVLPGFAFDHSSPYFQALFLILMIIWVVIVTILSVNWILSWIVVVAESVWGLTPLKRSKNLIKGRKGVSLSLILFFGVTQSILVWISSLATSWTTAFFVIQIVITSAFLTLLTLYNLAATTVVYIYCKAVHGELAWDSTEEFAREYVSLPFDDGKSPDFVSAAYDNV